jgi:hypothetical protein
MDRPIPYTEKARLVPLRTPEQAIVVHFNPSSLVYTVENSTAQPSGTPRRKQFAAQFSGKLTMDLQFDETDYGNDVRLTTNQVAMFMQSSANAARNKKGANAQAQPVLSFQWGSYEFKGTMESFKETIDFFSAEGVPLRSLVSITLARQDQDFDDATASTSDVNGILGVLSPPASLVPTGQDDSVNKITTQGGHPPAARQLGTDNGLESLRFTDGAALNVNAGIQFNAAAGFSASASGVASASASTGVSLGASAGVASSANLQISAGAGGGALFGGRASAGVPATAGAFAGLESGRATVSSTTNLDPLRMVRTTVSTDVATGANSSFSLGGTASAQVGFSSDVGANFNFSDQLVFDTD